VARQQRRKALRVVGDVVALGRVQQVVRRDRTVIELITKDRPGLLSQVAQAFAESDLVLQNARVNTYGERAEDAFFVTDANGRAVTDAGRLDRLREQLARRLDGELATPA
jgi:[protein-PII] uridylyltransferase